MNITTLINRKTATKRNETKANLDVVVSSLGNILFDLNSFKEIKKNPSSTLLSYLSTRNS